MAAHFVAWECGRLGLNVFRSILSDLVSQITEIVLSVTMRSEQALGTD